MASTFSTNLAIELIGTGDQAGTWGVTTNTNLGTLIEQAISGYVTQAVSTGADTTITIPNGATGVARNMYIELTGTGGTNTNLIVPSNKKLYFIFNNTASGQVTVKVSGQTGVSVPNGKKVVLVCNGTDIVNGLNYIADFGTNSFTVTNLTASSGTITNLIATTASISDASATVLRSASATITNLLGTTLTISGNSFLATSSGNVGVGTTSPAYKLDVSGSIRTTSFWALTGSPTGAGGSVRYIGGGGSSTNWYTNVPTGGSQFWAINESPVMALDSSGNLGIGTASPAQKLDVVGSGLFTVSGGNQSIILNTSNNAQNYNGLINFQRQGSVKFYAALDSSDNLAFLNSSASNLLTLDTSGNLGLGVTPSGWDGTFDAIEIGGAGNSVAGQANATQLALSGNAYYNGGWKYGRSAASSQYLLISGEHRFLTAASGTAGNPISFTQAMTLDASSNLIVGTTVNHPSARIFASGAINSNYDSTIALRYNVSGQTNNYYKGMTGTSIESSQARGLHIFNYDADSNPGISFYPNSYAGQTASASMTLNPSGNLGIGTSSPGEKLNVIGGGLTTSTVNFTGGTGNDNATIASDYSLVFQVDANNNVGGRAFNWRYGGKGYSDGTSLMTLDASSNLSVATTSTYSAYAKLHVLNGLVTATNATDGGVYIGATTGGTEIGYLSIGRSYNLAASGDTVLSTSAAKPLIFGTNNAERGRFSAGGQFLVGTTTAGVGGSGNTIFTAKGNADTYASIIASGNEELLLASQAGITKVGAYSNHPLLFITNNTERARIDTNGNVLVGMTSRPIPISNAIGYKSAANGMAGSATMNGTTWVDLVTLPIPTLGGARVNILGNENSNINTYYGTWTMLYSSTGWTIAGPYNEMQVGNDYGVPNLRISAGKIQVQARNGVSGGIIQYNIEYYAVA